MLVAACWLLGCTPSGDPPGDPLPTGPASRSQGGETPPLSPPPALWPARGAVHPLATPADNPTAEAGAPVHVLLDAGHGALDNGGNTNVRGEREQDVMRRITDGVAAAITAPGIVVTRTRMDARFVGYDQRVALADASDLLISLHSDARAGASRGWMDATAGTWWTEGATGFAVLWSDEGTPALIAARHTFACSLARNLAEAGFLPYPGADYPGLYDADGTVSGVYVDRHEPRQRIRLLRRPTVPSVIVETHEAHDRDEVARWEEPETWRAFATAVEATVVEPTRTTGWPSPDLTMSPE